MKPSAASCRALMWRIVLEARPRYSSTVCTPGMPKTVSTPRARSRSISASPTVRPAASLMPHPLWLGGGGGWGGETADGAARIIEDLLASGEGEAQVFGRFDPESRAVQHGNTGGA